MKNWFLVISFILFLSSCFSNEGRNGLGVVYADEYEHSFGIIPDSIHILRHTFVIHNGSSDTLHIKNIVKSCGCTKVIQFKDYISPEDTLHLCVEVDIGRSASFFEKDVNVYFSELAEPLSLYVNARRDKKEYPITQHFPCSLSENLRSSTGYLLFGYVEHGQIVHTSFNILNNSLKEIALYSSINPDTPFLSLSHPKTILPQQVARVILTFDASDIQDVWGEMEMDIKIGEKGTELYSLPISCIITDNFQDNPFRPRILMPITCYQIDELVTNEEFVSRTFLIKNIGESDLMIRNIKHEKGIQYFLGQNSIMPGEETELTIIVPVETFSNSHQIMVGISTNDRTEPYKIISLICPRCS